jgi:hypothetical protein
MKRARNIHRFGVLLLIMGWLLSLSPASVFAQEPSEVESEAVTADETAETPEAVPRQRARRARKLPSKRRILTRSESNSITYPSTRW